MAQNVFDATLDVNNNIKQNVFDWTHNNNLTTQLGRITPIFCDLLPAKSSFRVDPNFGMQFMPMVFPIQTSMRARVAFFRYPLRALWEDYTDFVGNFREGLEEPYVDINTQEKLEKMAFTCSLGDYLGLPTTRVGTYGSVAESDPVFDTTTPYGNIPFSVPAVTMPSNVGSPLPVDMPSYTVYNQYGYFRTVEYEFSKAVDFLANDGARPVSIDCLSLDESAPIANFRLGLYNSSRQLVSTLLCQFLSETGLQFDTFTSDIKDVKYAVLYVYCMAGVDTYDGRVFNGDSSSPLWNFAFIPGKLTALSAGEFVEELTLSTSPYYNSTSANKDKQIKLCAYAFRAYEGIYNAYFGDNRNNPYYIDGKVQYNKWIPTLAGGKDDNIYELRYANWERDFLTTAVQSPQQGTAPLVGITTYTQTVSNEDGTTTELVKTALVDEDGKKFGLSYKTSEDGLEGVEYTELSDGTQVRQARNLYDLATSGISIADLRAVNAYQKFLELNMRKGYSYRDIMQGRFDVKVRYDALLMPEFFGGCTRDVETHSVTQTVDQAQGINPTYAEALGSQAGLSGVRGSANANIECFCDEESIIIGVMILSPSAVYTQLLPKHFTYRGLMDHFQPEFNNIGFQPILYKEVCPIQAYNANPDSLTDTFGYNRPWYEYVQKYDQAHGLFRTDLSNFLMHRVFDQKPELAQSFLVIDPEQVTDVFAVTETTDKIYGQIRLNCTVKLPVSRVAIPRLD